MNFDNSFRDLRFTDIIENETIERFWNLSKYLTMSITGSMESKYGF